VSRAFGFLGYHLLRSAGLGYYTFIGIRLRIQRSVELHVNFRLAMKYFPGLSISLATFSLNGLHDTQRHKISPLQHHNFTKKPVNVHSFHQELLQFSTRCLDSIPFHIFVNQVKSRYNIIEYCLAEVSQTSLVLHQSQFLSNLPPLHNFLARSRFAALLRFKCLHQHACVEEAIC
jgi:hypothetical protein